MREGRSMVHASHVRSTRNVQRVDLAQLVWIAGVLASGACTIGTFQYSDAAGETTDIAPVDASDASDAAEAPDCTSGSFSVQQVANPAAACHPVLGTPGVAIHGPLVALTPRYVSVSSSGNGCTYSVWVGDPAGGPYSGIKFVDYEPASASADGGPVCATNDTNSVIPYNLAIGDTITVIQGAYEESCLPASPPGSCVYLYVANHGGTFSASSVGVGGPTPPPNVAAITDVNGTGTTTSGPMDLSLQNTLVELRNVFQQQVPAVSGPGANGSTMIVSGAMNDTSPSDEISVVVSGFPNTSCARTALGAAGVGASLGDVIGILGFSGRAGQWLMGITRATDVTGVNLDCTATDGGTDARVDAASDVPGG